MARSGEAARLRALVQRSEQVEAHFERRIAELEGAVADGNHKVEMLKRDLAEKTERLKRLSGLSES
jgi:chromosome segregation ATPase